VGRSRLEAEAAAERGEIGLSREELTQAMAAIGQPAFRARQLWHWIYHRGATDFAAMTNRLQEAPLTVRQARKYGRFLAMRATEDKPDKQGRITIPPLLKEYAGLAREVVVIGALNRVEIWDPTRIAAWEEEHSQAFAEMSEDVFPG